MTTDPKNRVRRLFASVLVLALALTGAAAARAEDPVRVRIKDIARIQGVESYTMTGYGLVVGLAGSGDSDEELPQRTIASLLENFSIVVDPDNVKAENTAVVMVTTSVDTSAHQGDMVPATVSSIGDAESLTGGELLLTPLLGPDGQMWATGQGAITTGSFRFGDGGGGGETQTKNHPTTGMLTNGVKLMRDVRFSLQESATVTLLLKEADFTTAVNMAEAINKQFPNSAAAVDGGKVNVSVPRSHHESQTVSRFIRSLEQIRFSPDASARVVFNERTGTIVFGGNVQISSVAITHGNLSISIKNTEGVSQPPPFSGGETERITDQQNEVTEEKVPVHLIPNVTTVAELVSTLNALGVTPRDTIVILHALREAGALHAELESL